MKAVHKEKSCGAVVFRIESGTPLFLVIHQRDGHWSFPKGHMKKHESQRETACREIREETGLLCAFVNGFEEKTHYHPRPDTRKTVVWYLAVPYDGKPQIQKEELSEMKWADHDEAMRLITYDNDRKLLEKALEFLDSQRKL